MAPTNNRRKKRPAADAVRDEEEEEEEEKDADDDGGADGHDDVCTFCERAGTLLCCDGCPRAFHALCVGMTQREANALGEWMCAFCESEGATIKSDPAAHSPRVVIPKAKRPRSSANSARRSNNGHDTNYDNNSDKKNDDGDDDFQASPPPPASKRAKSPTSSPIASSPSPKPRKSQPAVRTVQSPSSSRPNAPTTASPVKPTDEQGEANECWICRDTTAPQTECSGCPRFFHARCLGLRPDQLQEAAATWVCPYCVKQNRGTALFQIDPGLVLPPAFRLQQLVAATSTRHLTPSPRPASSASIRSPTPILSQSTQSSTPVTRRQSTPFDPAELPLPSGTDVGTSSPLSPPVRSEIRRDSNPREDEANVRRRGNGVNGPTSALTSFLAEKGISAHRIRQRHLERLAAAAAGDGVAPTAGSASASPAPITPDSSTLSSDGPGHNEGNVDVSTLGRNLYAFPTVDNRPSDMQPNRPRLRFEYVSEPVLDDRSHKHADGNDGDDVKKAKSKDKGGKSNKNNKRKKQKSHDGHPDPSDSSTDEEAEANRWIAGFRMVRRRVAFCGQVWFHRAALEHPFLISRSREQCDARLPDGVLRCTACAKRESTTRKAAYVSPMSKKRRAKGSEGSILEEVQGRVMNLQDLCIRYICDNIESVESFGDIAERARDRICHLVCHARRLTNETVRLFLDPHAESLRLYDCAKLDRVGFASLLPNLASLSSLNLKGCGRLEDDVVLQIADEAPLLTDLTLDGAFLVSDHAFALLISRLHLPLKRFAVTSSARIGLGAIMALAARCMQTLDTLKLSLCSNIDDACLHKLMVLENLEVLNLTDCLQVTDEGLFPLLKRVGLGLHKLQLRGTQRLRGPITGKTAEAAQTLPVASMQGRSAVLANDHSDDSDAESIDNNGDSDNDDGPRQQRNERRRLKRLDKMKAAAESDEATGTSIVFTRLNRGLIGPNLTKINLASTAFDDFSLGQLVEICHNIVWLDLTRTQVTSEGVDQLVASPTSAKLTHLWLNSLRHIRRLTLQQLANSCKSLHTLDVSWIREVDDDLLTVFRDKLTELRRVYIWGCNRVTECGVGAANVSKRFTKARLAVIGSFFVI